MDGRPMIFRKLPRQKIFFCHERCYRYGGAGGVFLTSGLHEMFLPARFLVLLRLILSSAPAKVRRIANNVINHPAINQAVSLCPYGQDQQKQPHQTHGTTGSSWGQSHTVQPSDPTEQSCHQMWDSHKFCTASATGILRGTLINCPYPVSTIWRSPAQALFVLLGFSSSVSSCLLSSATRRAISSASIRLHHA